MIGVRRVVGEMVGADAADLDAGIFGAAGDGDGGESGVAQRGKVIESYYKPYCKLGDAKYLRGSRAASCILKQLDYHRS